MTLLRLSLLLLISLLTINADAEQKKGIGIYGMFITLHSTVVS